MTPTPPFAPEKLFTILLAEDEPADANLVRLALAESRLVVDLHHVSDGVEALEFVRREGAHADAPRPDLILLDLNMPRMDGRECLAEIKNDPEMQAIPVVILTTSDVERDVAASYLGGAAGYVVKPVDIDQFLAAIRHLGQYWLKVVRVP